VIKENISYISLHLH